MASRIRLTTTGGRGLRDAINRVEIIDKYRFSVGVHRSTGQHGDSDKSVAFIATCNEFGLGVPERSFMRSTLFENERKYKNRLAKVIKRAVEGESGRQWSPDMLMGLLAQSVQDDIKRKITEIQDPPNAQETINRKGSSNPLIDTGQMRDSIRWEYTGNDANN